MSTLNIAHRGASGTRPEHTRAAFVEAIRAGVDMIELDVQLTRDGKLVVLHDRDLGRTVAGTGPVRDCFLADLQKLDAGSWFDPAYAGERVLSFDQVLDLLPERIRLNVEIKSPTPDWPATAEVLVRTLDESGRRATTITSSFEWGALRAVRELSEEIHLGILQNEPDMAPCWPIAEDLHATTIHPLWLFASPEVVTTAKRRGLGVIVWTVNDVVEMRTMIARGVDGIITDFPARLAHIRET